MLHPKKWLSSLRSLKENGGIEYAEAKMREFKNKAIGFIEEKIQDADIKQALKRLLRLCDRTKSYNASQNP